MVRGHSTVEIATLQLAGAARRYSALNAATAWHASQPHLYATCPACTKGLIVRRLTRERLCCR